VASYDAMKARVAVTHFPTYVRLDVGGSAFKTSVSTLRAARGSTLAAMFSGAGFDMTANEEGAYFIDRDGTHFRHVLNYLRGCFDAGTLGSDAARRELLVEADFYNLTGLCRLLSMRELPYSGKAADECGVLHWLGTGRGTRPWANPAEVPPGGGAAPVRVTSTMLQNSGPASNFASRAAQYVNNSGSCSVAQGSQHVLIEFLGGVRVAPTHYSLRFGNHCSHPSYWRLEACEDASAAGGENWALLREHTADTTLQQNGNVAAWPVTVPAAPAPEAAPAPGARLFAASPAAASDAPRFFSAFRFSMHTTTCCFHVGCFEVYGTVTSGEYA
jgi:hypothetical protein